MHHESPRSADVTCACNALRKASRAVTRFYDEVMSGTGLSLAQFAMLRNVGRTEPRPLVEIAEALVMDRTTLYRALKPLERQGWVAIADGKGRSKTAMLTEAGRRAILDATQGWNDAQERLLGRVGVERWADIERSLELLVALSQEEAR